MTPRPSSFGQHEIDDGRVVGILAAQFAAFFAIGADIDDVARFAQALGDKGGNLGVVF